MFCLISLNGISSRSSNSFSNDRLRKSIHAIYIAICWKNYLSCIKKQHKMYGNSTTCFFTKYRSVLNFNRVGIGTLFGIYMQKAKHFHLSPEIKKMLKEE